MGSGGRFAWGVVVRGGGVRGCGRPSGSGGANPGFEPAPGPEAEGGVEAGGWALTKREEEEP